MGVQVDFRRISSQVAKAAVKCGRDAGDVRVIAVSKTVGFSEIEEAQAQGASEFGENRPELLAQKAEAFPKATWHMIGNIQSRKIPQIVAHAALVHSLCDFGHAEKMDRVAASAGKVQDVLVEVNVSGEESKSGLSPDLARDFAHDVASLRHLRVCGLMTMAPQGDADIASDVFAQLADIQKTIRMSFGSHGQLGDAFKELSMGMTEDWPLAVAHGATIVRIGRAIFPPSEN